MFSGPFVPNFPQCNPCNYLQNDPYQRGMRVVAVRASICIGTIFHSRALILNRRQQQQQQKAMGKITSQIHAALIWIKALYSTVMYNGLR